MTFLGGVFVGALIVKLRRLAPSVLADPSRVLS
jgi:hypothetical protein